MYIILYLEGLFLIESFQITQSMLDFLQSLYNFFQKNPREKMGKKDFIIQNILNKEKKDLEFLLNQRINELVPGGILHAFIGAYKDDDELVVRKHMLGVLDKLVEYGLITQDELDYFDMFACFLNVNDWIEVLSKLQGRAKVLDFKIDKHTSPYYTDFIRDHDLEKYVTGFSEFLLQIVGALVQQNIKRSPEDMKIIMDRMRTYFREHATAHQLQHNIEYAEIQLVKL